MHWGGLPVLWHPSHLRRSMTIAQRRSRREAADCAGAVAGTALAGRRPRAAEFCRTVVELRSLIADDLGHSA